MNALVAEWVAKAEADFNTARRELRVRRAPNYDGVCYHSQQCAEKLLKAFLIGKQVHPPPTHNLVELVRLCLRYDGTFELIRPDLESLNGYSVVIRYPGVSAAKQDAAAAVKAAQHVQDFMIGKL